jgi:hypothetical protein
MKSEELPPYLFSIIAPIYHTVNGQFSREKGFGKLIILANVERSNLHCILSSTIVEDLKNLGNEVLGMVQKKAGPTAYFAIYQNIRQHTTDVKVERKAQRAVESIANPELAAKRKMARNFRKSSSSKRVRFN